MISSTRTGASEIAPVRVRFLLDKCRSATLYMKKDYSISEVARIVGVNRRTLQRWILNKQIPLPKMEIVDGKLKKSWAAAEVTQIREHKQATYRGKGIDRRTGKKAKNKQAN
jgi:excisionase family DNA binding protein